MEYFIESTGYGRLVDYHGYARFGNRRMARAIAMCGARPIAGTMKQKS